MFKKMPLRGSSSMMIQPCYDGHTLIGVHQVAGDGLSAISIKQSHRDCKFTAALDSKHPLISCAQGIKARNSFYNLHKPDLRRVKGLECASTDSMTQIFRAHNVENAGKPTYKKKMLRLLESLVTKKSKSPPQPKVVIQNAFWPANMCVLSSVCQEKEVKVNDVVNSHKESSSTLDLPEVTEISEDVESQCSTMHAAETVGCSSLLNTEYISHPPSTMLVNSSENAFVGFYEITNSSNGDTSTGHTFIPHNDPHILQLKKTNETNTFSSLTLPSNFKLNHKKALAHISSLDSHSFTIDKTNTSNIDEETTQVPILKDSILSQTENPSTQIVKSIFTEMFKEMQEIENYISLYLSSFCIREEEYENYPALNRTSSEVVSHFFEQVRSSNELGMDKHEVKDTDSINVRLCYKEGSKNIIPETSIHQFPEMERSVYNFFEDGKHLEVNVCGNGNKFNPKPELNESSKNSLEGKYSEARTGFKEYPSCGYCYWEHMDEASNLLSEEELLRRNTSTNYHNKMVIENNQAIIPASFFESIKKELIENERPHSLLVDLKNENNKVPSSENVQLPFYDHWKIIYNEGILDEAENVFNSVDNFLDNGCFPNSGNVGFTNSCTITEISDSYENVWLNSGKRTTESVSPATKQYYTSETKPAVTPTIIQPAHLEHANLKKGLNNEGRDVVDDQISYSMKLKNEINTSGLDFVAKPESANDDVSSTRLEGKEDQKNEAIPKLIQTLTNQEHVPKRLNTLNSNSASNGHQTSENTQEETFSLSIPESITSTFRLESTNNSEQTTSKFIFSSPHVQLNLTNPVLNSKKR